VELTDLSRYKIATGRSDVLFHSTLECVDNSANAMHDPLLEFPDLGVGGVELRINCALINILAPSPLAIAGVSR